MFDPVTREFLASAPSLPGLPAEALADEFTATYIEIAAARLTLAASDPQSFDHLAELAERMGRIANVLESQVILGMAGERSRAAAFVAGSARQVVFQIAQLLATSPGSRVDEFAISADLAASLLFLISERSADAYETSRLIDARGMSGVRGQIAIAISHLARGQLERIIEIVPERFEPRYPSLEGNYACDLLYVRSLQGLHLLAQVCLGRVDIGGLDEARRIFAEVRDLSVDFVSEAGIESPFSIQAPSIFPGPHHLAGLLERTAGTLKASAVVRVDSPGGANAQSWREWLKTEAVRYPFLWENHQRALSSGFLDVGKSLVMTSPTGSGKPTRQLKACVCYERGDVDLVNIRLSEDARRRRPFPKSVPAAVKKIAGAAPLALFSAGMGWHPDAPKSFALRSVVDEVIPLGVARRAAARRWALTANRNEVAAELAVRFSKAGLKVVVFCESIPTTVSVARRLNDAFDKLNPCSQMRRSLSSSKSKIPPQNLRTISNRNDYLTGGH